MFVCSAASRLDCRFMCYVKHLFAASLKFNYTVCVTVDVLIWPSHHHDERTIVDTIKHSITYSTVNVLHVLVVISKSGCQLQLHIFAVFSGTESPEMIFDKPSF